MVTAAALDERSSSDDDNDNCNNYLIDSGDNDENDTVATACLYNRHFDVDNCSSDSEDSDDADSYESDEYSVAVENQSDTDDKGSIDSNASRTSNSNSSLFESNSSLCDSNSSLANSNHANQFINPVHQLFGESENTTQSYSNSLLEDNIGCADNSDNDFEADEQFEDVRLLPDMSRLDISRTAHLSDLDNGNYHTTSFSESESPTTEPSTQKALPI